MVEKFGQYIAGLIVLYCVIGGPMFGYQLANSNGWVRHTVVTPVEMGNGWMAGEYRQCSLEPHVQDGQPNTEIGNPLLWCWSGNAAKEEHKLPVAYWGRVDRNSVTGWECQRSDSSLICKAIN